MIEPVFPPPGGIGRRAIGSQTQQTTQGSVRQWIRGSLIGAGSFGKVSLAINKDSGELFAVKSIDCSERAKAELLAMENELRILQSLDSPQIVRCLGSDYSVENGVRKRNLFMEYMAGGSLADLMKKFGGQLEESLIRLYTKGILQGLQYLHGQGVVHCDIKGKNILIGASGVKLADFGAAKRLGTEEDQMRGCFLGDIGERGAGSPSMKGTPLWMAPEVVQQVEQGPASDIWSLGCTIVEMATGRAPWSNSPNSFVALYRIGCTEEVPALPGSLSAEGKDFLWRCFQRDPKARWTSAQLLKHPFLEKEGKGDFVSPLYTAPSSPTSILDFPSDSNWDSQSAIVNSVPILSLHRKAHKLQAVSNDGSCALENGGATDLEAVDESRLREEASEPNEEGGLKQSQCAEEGIMALNGEARISRPSPEESKEPGQAQALHNRWNQLPSCCRRKLMMPPSDAMGQKTESCNKNWCDKPPPSPTQGHWITVRSPKGCSEDRQKPLSDFMLRTSASADGPAAGDGNKLLHTVRARKGSEVNLDCLAFLRRRKDGVMEHAVGDDGDGAGERSRGSFGAA